MRKTMTIEDALRWTYRDELPKAQVEARGPAAWGGPARLRGGHEAAAEAADLWAVPDNRYGVVPDRGGDGAPHADALAIHAAVLALDSLAPDLPADWGGFADLELGPCAAEVARDVLAGVFMSGGEGLRLRRPLSVLIRNFAILGLPDLTLDEPEQRVAVAANGKPRWFRKIQSVGAFGEVHEVEVDGYDPKAKAPYPDAYGKTYLDPCPVDVLVARMEAEVWRAALDVLVEDLAGSLEAVELLPSTLCERPWETNSGRVLRDRTATNPLATLPNRRPVAGLVTVRATGRPAKRKKGD
jgi:hypothetical protein